MSEDKGQSLAERLPASRQSNGHTGASAEMSPVQPRQTAFPIRYLLVLWLFVLSAVAYLDRTNISIAGVQIGSEFAIDKIHLGWVFSAFLVGYASLQIPAGLLAKRFGPRLVLSIGCFWWSAFTILTALVPPSIL